MKACGPPSSPIPALLRPTARDFVRLQTQGCPYWGLGAGLRAVWSEVAGSLASVVAGGGFLAPGSCWEHRFEHLSSGEGHGQRKTKAGTQGTWPGQLHSLVYPVHSRGTLCTPGIERQIRPRAYLQGPHSLRRDSSSYLQEGEPWGRGVKAGGGAAPESGKPGSRG